MDRRARNIIADLHNSAKVWVSYSEYTISKSHSVLLVLLLSAMPFLFRVIRSPRVALVIAIAIAVAWFGPRMLKFFKRK